MKLVTRVREFLDSKATQRWYFGISFAIGIFACIFCWTNAAEIVIPQWIFVLVEVTYLPTCFLALLYFILKSELAFLSPGLYLGTHVFSFLFCSDDKDIAISDWRFLTVLSMFALFTLINVYFFARITKPAPKSQ